MQGRAQGPRVGLGLRPRPDDQRQAAEVAVDRGRVHPGVRGVGDRSGHHGRPGDRRVGGPVPHPRRAQVYPQRQRAGVHQSII